MKISDRLRSAVAFYRTGGGNLEVALYDLGISNANWIRYTQDIEIPPAKVVSLLANEFGVNAEWLATGKRTML